MICALVQNSTVVSITSLTEEGVQSAASSYEAVVDITDANPMPTVGWLFDGNKLIPANGTATPSKKITKLGLRRRFTFTELCTLTAAANTVIPVNVLMTNLSVSTYVDLSRADTIAGIGLLVSLGLLTSDRAATILNTPIQEDERYKGNE